MSKNLQKYMVIGLMLLLNTGLVSNTFAAEKSGSLPVYDVNAYPEYVSKTMKKLDKLYLQFCDKCNADASKASKAKQEYFATVRDLLQHMNARFDSMNPKAGAALSPTDTLVSIHVLTMLVDMLTETQMKDMAEHPYNQ
jgi:hypothetical protein